MAQRGIRLDHNPGCLPLAANPHGQHPVDRRRSVRADPREDGEADDCQDCSQPGPHVLQHPNAEGIEAFSPER